MSKRKKVSSSKTPTYRVQPKRGKQKKPKWPKHPREVCKLIKEGRERSEELE